MSRLSSRWGRRALAFLAALLTLILIAAVWGAVVWRRQGRGLTAV